MNPIRPAPSRAKRTIASSPAFALAVALALFATPLAPAFAQSASAPVPEPLTVGAVVDAMQQPLASQCDVLRTTLALSTPKVDLERLMINRTKDGICTCVPAGLLTAFGADRAAFVDRQTAMTRVQGVIATCAARSLRAAFADACAARIDPTDTDPQPLPAATPRQQAHCGCLQSGLAGIDDAALADDATGAYERSKKRAEARAAGASEPAHVPGRVESAIHACAAQDAPAR